MGLLHDRIAQHGRQGALAFADTALDRKALEAAFTYMSDDESSTGFLFSGWCQTALPHRRLADDEIWTLETDHVKLMVEPGSMHGPDGAVRVGVPYGSRARLILLYLQSEAIRTNSRQIELGRSLRVWFAKRGVPIGRKGGRDVRERALRISRCRMTFQITRGDKVGFINQNIVDSGLFSSEGGGPLLETVHLSERFFNELKLHPVPLQEAAIKALSNSSQALDIYCWMTYRLHSLPRDTHITWAALRAQFGTTYSGLRDFRKRFIESLQMALAVYPDAKVEISQAGLSLKKSRPPVAIR